MLDLILALAHTRPAVMVVQVKYFDLLIKKINIRLYKLKPKMKKILSFIFCLLFISISVFSQENNKPVAEQKKLKAKHLLPNGEPDRPFTFFAKHGFAFYPDAARSEEH